MLVGSVADFGGSPYQGYGAGRRYQPVNPTVNLNMTALIADRAVHRAMEDGFAAWLDHQISDDRTVEDQFSPSANDRSSLCQATKVKGVRHDQRHVYRVVIYPHGAFLGGIRET